MIYSGHYSSLLVLPFFLLLFSSFLFVILYPIRREKVSFFFLLSFSLFFHPLAMLTRYSNKNVKHGVSFVCQPMRFFSSIVYRQIGWMREKRVSILSTTRNNLSFSFFSSSPLSLLFLCLFV